MMEQRASRGGAKPRMMVGSEDWAMEIGGARKVGIYEFNGRTGELARRVELPHWLDQLRRTMSSEEFKAALAQGSAQAPREEIGESRGHIYLVPPAELGLQGSAVGVDLPIFQKMALLGSRAKWIRFVGYGPYYEGAFQWRVPFEEFKANAVLVESRQFMPQMMASISGMKAYVAR